MSRILCYQVDAFAQRAFAGNPAAVCPLNSWLPDALMQAIAAENALSETAFFVRRSAGDDPRRDPGGDDIVELRWFTPEVEVDLCGHATLAAAFVLLGELEPGRTHVRFSSRSGILEVTRQGDRYVLDFPARPAEPLALEGAAGAAVDTALGAAVGAALGGTPRELWRSRDLVAVFASAEEVRALRPDMAALAALPDTFAVCATAPGTGADADVDFVSRFFAPAAGVPEDPVTGSAHCTLVPLWAKQLGRTTLRARQVSRRTGELACELVGERVHLGGHAVLVRSGWFHLPE